MRPGTEKRCPECGKLVTKCVCDEEEDDEDEWEEDWGAGEADDDQ